MDWLFRAISYYRRHEFEKCNNVCTSVLEKDAFNKAALCLKMKASNQEVYIEDLEADEEGLAELLMDENSIAQVARPGTSLKTPTAAQHSSQGYRPFTQASRPLSGVTHAGTQCGQQGSVEGAIRTRSAHSVRPLTSSSGRFVNFGTGCTADPSDEYFLNFARANISKYANVPNLAKPLFEYLYYSGNDIRQALDLAALATQACLYKDWWWKFQLGKCYNSLGMYRDAEKQFKSAIKQQNVIDAFLWLGKVYIRLDQPLAALDIYKQGLEAFPGDTALMIYIARMYERLDDFDLAVKYYKEILTYDATEVEAVACIAMHYFYADQPEIALRFYRRLLQMGVCNSELHNNLALCCFFSQQYDMSVMCFERALALCNNDSLADIWYNIGHLSLGTGDQSLSAQCFRLALVENNNHAESYNNLGVIETFKGNANQAKAYFNTAASLAQYIFEPNYNQALLAEQAGDLQNGYIKIKKALETYPAHVDSKVLLKRMQSTLNICKHCV